MDTKLTFIAMITGCTAHAIGRGRGIGTWPGRGRAYGVRKR
jgi:hypothetical protein